MADCCCLYKQLRNGGVNLGAARCTGGEEPDASWPSLHAPLAADAVEHTTRLGTIRRWTLMLLRCGDVGIKAAGAVMIWCRLWA
jgi:hypothetical protein